MAISAGQVFVDLGARMDRSEFRAYEKELNKVQERTAKRERFKAELGANFDTRAFNAYERELKKADRANDNMVRSNGRLRTSFGSVWSKGGAAFAAAGGAFALVSAIKGVVKANADAEASQSKVKQMVENAGFSWEAHAEQIDKVIQAHSRLSGFDDEDLAESFANMIRTTGSLSEAMKLNNLVMDVARAKGTDLAGAQSLVARVYNGSFTGLKRLGIAIEPVTTAQDALKASTDKASDSQKRAAKETDKIATRQQAIAKLQKTFAGQAEAYGKTQQGAIDRVGVAWENLQEKLGERLAPTVTRVATRLAKFIDEMTNGTGAGGRFADSMERGSRNLQKIGNAAVWAFNAFQDFARGVRVGARDVADTLSDTLGVVAKVNTAMGKLPGPMGAPFRAAAKAAKAAQGELDDFKKHMDVGIATRDVARDIARMGNKSRASIADLRKDTAANMSTIRKHLGADSKAGADALHDNFVAAAAAIRRSMRNGVVSTEDGLAEIRRLMLSELKTLGISSALKSGKPLSPNPPKGGDVPVVKYAGGWIGAPGMVGGDSVPAMLAPGEAVLNRHQQAVIEGMLGGGFLDRLFATVNRPHYMQRGGRIPFAVGGVTPAISSLIEELDSKGFRHGSTTGPGHAPGGYHPRGMAVDYGDASNDMQRLWSVVFPQRRRFAELFGPTRVTPGPHLMHNGAAFQNAALQADHQDHIHMALAAAIGALGSGTSAVQAAWKAIKTPQSGLTGLLGDVVQGSLSKVTAAANRRGRSLAGSAGGLPGAGITGGGGNAANQALGRRLLSSFGFGADQWPPLRSLWTGESGWNERASNPSSGAYGIPQALPGSKMASAGSDWRTNAATQIRWGLGYIKGRYGSPSGAYSAWLGRSPHWYAKGGKVKPKTDKLVKVVGGKTAGIMRGIRPLQTDRSSSFEAIMGRVQADEDSYGRWESRFNITDEELVDSDTGQVNTAAVNRKAGELAQLLVTRNTIIQELIEAQKVVRLIIKSYTRVVNALKRSLRHSSKKNRKGIRSYIGQYEGRISEWKGKLGEVGGSLFDARTDAISLRAELKDVMGTAPNIQVPDASSLDSGAGGADTSAAADTPAGPPSPLQIAEGAAAEMRSFLAGRQDLLQSFGRNFVQRSAAGASFTAPDALTAAAGVRAFGGASSGGLGGATIIANFASAPDNAPTFVQQIRFIAEGG